MGQFGRNLAGSLAVALGVAVFWVGIPAVNKAINPERPVPAGVPLPVGQGVTIVPPPGAVMNGDESNSFAGTLTLVAGGVRYRLLARSTPLTLEQLADQVRQEIQKAEGVQTVDDEQDVVTTQGVPGKAAGFVSTNTTGRYAVFTRDGVGVEFLAEGPPSAMLGERANVDAVMESIAFGGGA